MARILQGRYELGRVLGTGGMGQVLEATDRQLGRQVAVKLVAGDSVDPAVRTRLLREATTAAQFTHPNAVAVYDVGEDDGTLYLVMELIGGPTLAELLADAGRLEEDDAVKVADQVLAAAGAGHVRGLVHRDIKPSNILFTEDGVAKLADFGIAKGIGEIAASVTDAGQVLGTPRYLSPEQVTGRDATPASDLYAVGVVLYEMLAGHPPFDGETSFATARAHQSQPLPSLARHRPGLDPGLATVVERALAKDPEDRYPHAAAMRTALAFPAAAATATAAARTTDAATTLPVGPALDRSGTTLIDTQPMGAVSDTPADGGDESAIRRPRPAVLVPLALVAAGIGFATVLVTQQAGDDEPNGTRQADRPPPASSEATTTSEPSTTTAPESTTTTSPASTTAPADARTVADRLAAEPGAYGDKGKDLLDKLQKIAGRNGNGQAKEASKTIDEIVKWVNEGKLDPAIGQQAISELEPLADR